MVPGEYITTAEVAALLKISPSTAQRMAREGRISALKIGKLWRFPAQSPGILLYKQEQKSQRHGKTPAAEKDAPQKSGLKAFVRLAADVGFVEPFQREALYGGSR